MVCLVFDVLEGVGGIDGMGWCGRFLFPVVYLEILHFGYIGERGLANRERSRSDEVYKVVAQ